MAAREPREYQMCTRCVMDTTDPDIRFDKNGVCNHCHTFDGIYRTYVPRGQDAERQLKRQVSEIQAAGRKREYDCILGLSGGVDSSFVAYQAKKLGLRPLAVHLDNGWDTELAVANVEKLVSELDMDLESYVIDWEEFRDLQLAFLRASVVDIEMLTDHAITASLHRIAARRRIRYLLSGSNIATEGIMPKTWYHLKSDLRNILAIHRRFGTVRIRSFPRASIFRLQYYKYLKGIRTVNLLNYIDYNKRGAMEVLESGLHWRYYGGKHYESAFTRFYQAYILPTKFNIDKRRAHLSSLICSGQLTRTEALQELERDLYDPEELARDREYVVKKLGLSREEFEEIMKNPPRSHLDFPSSLSLVNSLLAAKATWQKHVRPT